MLTTATKMSTGGESPRLPMEVIKLYRSYSRNVRNNIGNNYCSFSGFRCGVCESGEKMNPLYEVLTSAEAAERWGRPDRTIRRQKGYPSRFKEGEFRQSGKVWLIIVEGMTRVFGAEPVNE